LKDKIIKRKTLYDQEPSVYQTTHLFLMGMRHSLKVDVYASMPIYWG